jgi:hypothetical protein
MVGLADIAFEVGKGIFTLSVTALTAFAVIVAVLRISKIIEAVKAFRDKADLFGTCVGPSKT